MVQVPLQPLYFILLPENLHYKISSIGKYLLASVIGKTLKDIHYL
jgi:hypothetical protein